MVEKTAWVTEIVENNISMCAHGTLVKNHWIFYVGISTARAFALFVGEHLRSFSSLPFLMPLVSFTLGLHFIRSS